MPVTLTQPGAYPLQVTVTDTAGLSAVSAVIVTVAPLTAPSNVTATPGDGVVLIQRWRQLFVGDGYDVHGYYGNAHTRVDYLLLAPSMYMSGRLLVCKLTKMKKIIVTSISIFVLWLFMLPLRAADKTISKIATSRQNVNAKSIAEAATYWRWLNSPWDKGDQDFFQIQHQVDQAIRSGKNPSDLIELYQKLASAHPHDAHDQFQYYYAVFKSARIPNNGIGASEWTSKLIGLNEVIVNNKFPSTYSFVRLVFCVGIIVFPSLSSNLLVFACSIKTLKTLM